MFGIIRPCRNRLGTELRDVWAAHLCGICLALRDEHGQCARLVTNYDAVVVSALVEAQDGAPSDANGRRRAGPCALRGMRPASVARGDGVRLAAATSLLLSSCKLRDHVADGDVSGPIRSRAATALANRLARAGTATAAELGMNGQDLLDAADRQAAVESAPTDLLEVTALTEYAAGLTFARTAAVAGRPGNAAPLAEAGRLFGRVAHLLDAVTDLEDDLRAGAWNPITALGLTPNQVYRRCADAVLGVRLALRDAEFTDGRLVHVLLTHELDAAVRRTFTAVGHPPPDQSPPPLTPPLPPGQQPPRERPPGWEAPPAQDRKRGPAACVASLVACGTCQACSSDDADSADDADGSRRGCGDRLCGGRTCESCCDCCDCCSDCDCFCDC